MSNDPGHLVRFLIRRALWGAAAAVVCLGPLWLLVDMQNRQERRETIQAHLQTEGRAYAESVQARWPDLEDSQALCNRFGPNLLALRLGAGNAACVRGWGFPLGGAERERMLAGAMEGQALTRVLSLGGVVPGGAEEVVLVAVPLRIRGQVVGAMLLGAPLQERAKGALAMDLAFLAAGVALVVLWVGGAWIAGRKRAREGRLLGGVLTAWASGDLTARLPGAVTGMEERWPETLNRLIADLDVRLRERTHRLNEREAVLRSMVEGVVAVDSAGRLIELNRAAAALFATDTREGRGRPLLESVRNPELVRFVEETLTAAGPIEGELELYGAEPRFLQAHGTPLLDAGGQRLGALIVLNDVTRLRRLEGLRREFVANVSHELKTPVTSILGFVETLLDGALDQPGEARRFLEIISRQTERLNGIIEDLLSLSRIEQEAEAGTLDTEVLALDGVLRSAVGLCEERARNRGVTLLLESPPGQSVRLNPRLIEQAVVNLIDNAVKYGGENGTVRIAAEVTGERVTISVQDEGPGIPREARERLFERFYRVDKARSRSEGGTGLGLAIVKHIAQAHGGEVAVSSAPGQGSTFRMTFPRGV